MRKKESKPRARYQDKGRLDTVKRYVTRTEQEDMRIIQEVFASDLRKSQIRITELIAEMNNTSRIISQQVIELKKKINEELK